MISHWLLHVHVVHTACCRDLNLDWAEILPWPLPHGSLTIHNVMTGPQEDKWELFCFA